MMRFANEFSDKKIVSTLSTQLSWSQFIVVIPLKTMLNEEKVQTVFALLCWSYNKKVDT